MITKFEKGKYYKYNGNEAPAHWQSKECPVTDHKPRMCLNVLFDTNAAFEGMGDERACWDWGKDLSLWEEVVTVNEDGCLAEERTGLFPKVYEIFDNLWKVFVYVNDDLEHIEVVVYGKTKQEAIDAWNRRAR